MEPQIPADACTVLLIEDDGPTGWAVSDALSGDPAFHYLGQALDRVQGEQLVVDHAPDIILVDLALPIVDPAAGSRPQPPSTEEGMRAIQSYRRLSPTSRIVAFSRYFVGQAELVARAMAQGATHVMAKQALPTERANWAEWLRRELIDVVKGRMRIDPVVSQIIYGQEKNRPKSRVADLDALSSRELEVLNLLAQGKTDSEIGEQLFIRPTTVRVHVGNILSKLHARNRTEAVIQALKAGLTEK